MRLSSDSDEPNWRISDLLDSTALIASGTGMKSSALFVSTLFPFNEMASLYPLFFRNSASFLEMMPRLYSSCMRVTALSELAVMLNIQLLLSALLSFLSALLPASGLNMKYGFESFLTFSFSAANSSAGLSTSKLNSAISCSCSQGAPSVKLKLVLFSLGMVYVMRVMQIVNRLMWKIWRECIFMNLLNFSIVAVVCIVQKYEIFVITKHKTPFLHRL